MGDLQPGLFQGSKGAAAAGEQFGFEGAPAGFGLRVVGGIARPAEAGQGTGLLDAGAAGDAGVLAAAIGVGNETRRGLAQRQGLFQRVEHEFGGHLRGQVLPHDPA